MEMIQLRSWNTDWATGWKTWFQIPVESRTLSLKGTQQIWCPSSLLFNEYWCSLPGERLKIEGQSTPYSAEVQNERSYISTPLYAFMVWTETASPWPFTATHIISTFFRIYQNAPFLMTLQLAMTDAVEKNHLLCINWLQYYNSWYSVAK